MKKTSELEHSAAKEQSRNQTEFLVMTEELKNENMLLTHKNAHLGRENQRLEGELRVFRFFAEENKALRASINSMSAQLLRLTQLSQLESENMIAEMENWKQELDREYSERVRENAQQAWLAAKSQKREFDRTMEREGMAEVLTALKHLNITPASSQPHSRINSRPGTSKPGPLQSDMNLSAPEADHAKTLQLLYYRMDMMQNELNRYKKLYKNERKRISVGQSLSIWNSKFSCPVDDEGRPITNTTLQEDGEDELQSDTSLNSADAYRSIGPNTELGETVFRIEYEGDEISIIQPPNKPLTKSLGRSGKLNKSSRKSWASEREEKEKQMSVLNRGRRVLLP